MKYELTDETIQLNGTTRTNLYRIRALIDFGNIKAGELGGYVESVNNLSQTSDAFEDFIRAVVEKYGAHYGSYAMAVHIIKNLPMPK